MTLSLRSKKNSPAAQTSSGSTKASAFQWLFKTCSQPLPQKHVLNTFITFQTQFRPLYAIWWYGNLGNSHEPFWNPSPFYRKWGDRGWKEGMGSDQKRLKKQKDFLVPSPNKNLAQAGWLKRRGRATSVGRSRPYWWSPMFNYNCNLSLCSHWQENNGFGRGGFLTWCWRPKL